MTLLGVVHSSPHSSLTRTEVGPPEVEHTVGSPYSGYIHLRLHTELAIAEAATPSGSRDGPCRCVDECDPCRGDGVDGLGSCTLIR